MSRLSTFILNATVLIAVVGEICFDVSKLPGPWPKLFYSPLMLLFLLGIYLECIEGTPLEFLRYHVWHHKFNVFFRDQKHSSALTLWVYNNGSPETRYYCYAFDLRCLVYAWESEDSEEVTAVQFRKSTYADAMEAIGHLKVKVQDSF